MKFDLQGRGAATFFGWIRYVLLSCVFASVAIPAFAAKTYADNGGGTVTDPTTGLTWMRCAMGQTWSGATCTREASTNTWEQANAITGTVTLGGQSDWRLPNVRELQTIVDRTRTWPAVDTTAFPSFPSMHYWSSSPNAISSPGYARSVYLNGADLQSKDRSGSHLVRLVRNSQINGQASQTIDTISFGPTSLSVGGTSTISATAGSGLAVTFSSTTPTICSVLGSNVTGLQAGTCTVAANQSGNANYTPAPQVTQSTVVSQNLQTIGPISFTPATLAVGGATTAIATATSGLVVTFNSITPTRCAVSGATVVALETGSCTIAANQAGDDSFAAAAQVTKDISITQANVTDLIDLSDVTQIDAGYQYTCAVTATGGVKCWGLNSRGQLGDGTKSSRGSATNVTGLTSGVVAVSVGRGSSEVSHTCALTTSGAVKCWGANESGQLGDGTTVERLTPVDVVGLGGGAVAVSSGGQHTCAVMTSGDVKCWGDNALGQLGDGTQVQRLTPVRVVGLNAPTVAISTSFQHTCAISNVGGAFCWGSNVSGELGDGTTVSRSTPIGVSSLENGTQAISAGGVPYAQVVNFMQGGLQTCAVTAAGGVKCWGENQVGGHLTPYEVSGLTSGVASVSTGALGGYYSLGHSYWVETHACALKTNGSVACWGGNSGGQLICTDAANPVSPVEVLGIKSPSKQVSAGGSHTCALSVGGLVECWGGKEGSIRVSATDPPACQPRSVTVTASGLTVQQIAFSGPTSVPIAGSAEIMATGGDSGNPVIFTSLTPSTCSITGSAVSGLTGGLCIVAGNQLGNDVYEPAVQVLHKLRVGDPIAQVIAFGDIPPIAVGGTGKLVASASSGLPVTFSSNTPSICAVSRDNVSGLATGICTIAADQMGDQVYARAPQTTKDISVSKTVNQSISFGVAPSVSVGSTGTLSATATSGLAVSLSSSTERYCTVVGSIVTGVSVGTCTIVADQAGNATYAPAPQVTQNITIQPAVVASPHRLLNIATRGRVETVDNVMIAGFIIQGSTPKKVLIRARGPSLAAAPFNVPGTLSDPFLTLYSGATPIDSNDDFAQHANAAQIPADWIPANAKEAAIVTTLNPGAYTAIVNGVAATSGVAIVEVFEIDQPDTPLINIATRGPVYTGDNVMIAGLIIQGDAPKTVLITARGPSMAGPPHNVPGTLANPTLSLFSGQTVIATNDNWTEAANAAQIQTAIGAPSNTLESAILVTLQPGAYTAIVSGAGGGTGLAIVEVFAQ